MVKQKTGAIITLLIAFLLFITGAKAQLNSTVAPTKDMPVVCSIIAGTQGPGVQVKVGVLKKFTVRAGVAFLPPHTYNNIVPAKYLNSINLYSKDEASDAYTNVHLLIDYTPFKHDNLRIVGGAAYLIKATGNFTLLPQSYKYGDVNLTNNELGAASVSIDWSGIAPYLGISLFNGVPSKLFNVNLEVGTYYLVAPSTNITGIGVFQNISSINEQFQKNMSGWRWLPVLQLDFNFKLPTLKK